MYLLKSFRTSKSALLDIQVKSNHPYKKVISYIKLTIIQYLIVNLSSGYLIFGKQILL